MLGHRQPPCLQPPGRPPQPYPQGSLWRWALLLSLSPRVSSGRCSEVKCVPETPEKKSRVNSRKWGEAGQRGAKGELKSMRPFCLPRTGIRKSYVFIKIWKKQNQETNHVHPSRGLELRLSHFCCGLSPEGMTPPGDSSHPCDPRPASSPPSVSPSIASDSGFPAAVSQMPRGPTCPAHTPGASSVQALCSSCTWGSP